jgi:aspartyl-tRNA(Asn)/glutamyl-tRNA(Gln) amidotransferase subunit C
MALTTKQVQKVASLAKIHINETELESTANDLNKIMSWINKLSEVDTAAIEPLMAVHQNSDAVLRDDIVTEGDNSKSLSEAAPESMYNYICVPKVIE